MVLGIMRSKKFSKRVLTALLIIIIPAFVFWGVGSLTDRPKPVGRIFGRTVSAEDFISSRRGVQIQIILNYFSDYAAMNSILKNRALMNTMAWERLLLLGSARGKKLNVTNENVMEFISSHPLFQRGGVFDKFVYNSVLKSSAISLSPREFEELVRENLLVMQFRDTLVSNITVNDNDILRKFSERFGKAAFSYFLVDENNDPESLQVTEQEVAEVYERNKPRLFSAEKAEVEYVEVPYSSLQEKDRAILDLEKAAAEISGENLSLERLADRMGARYGKAPFFSRGDTLSGDGWFPGFNETAFNLENNEISPPVFSQADKGSAFIIRRTGTKPPEPLSLDDVRQEITTALKNAKRTAMAKTKAEALFQAISSEEVSFEDAAGSIGSEVKKTPLLGSEDRIEDLFPAREPVVAALSDPEKMILPPFVTPKGVLLLRVDNISEAPLSELTDEMKASLKNTIKTEKQAAAVTDWLNQHSSEIELFRALEEM